MDTHMNISSVFVLESLPAGQTHKGSDTLVPPLMNLVIFTGQKLLATEGADELLLPVAVDTRLVLVHELTSAKPTLADIALVGFLTGVFLLVVIKCAFRGKGSGAEGALERSVLGMLLDMNQQLAFHVKAFLTEAAGEFAAAEVDLVLVALEDVAIDEPSRTQLALERAGTIVIVHGFPEHVNLFDLVLIVCRGRSILFNLADLRCLRYLGTSSCQWLNAMMLPQMIMQEAVSNECLTTDIASSRP